MPSTAFTIAAVITLICAVGAIAVFASAFSAARGRRAAFAAPLAPPRMPLRTVRIDGVDYATYDDFVHRLEMSHIDLPRRVIEDAVLSEHDAITGGVPRLVEVGLEPNVMASLRDYHQRLVAERLA